MPLGTDVGLGPGDIVLDGGPSSPIKRAQSLTFWPMSTVAERPDGSRCHLVRQLALAQATLLDGDPAPSPLQKGGGAQPKFSALVSCGQTVAHLGYC